MTEGRINPSFDYLSVDNLIQIFIITHVLQLFSCSTNSNYSMSFEYGKRRMKALINHGTNYDLMIIFSCVMLLIARFDGSESSHSDEA